MGEKFSERFKEFKEHEATFIKIIRWLFFGVIVSLLPYWFVLSLYPASDLLTSELDSLLDLLLISIAVLANAINLFWDNKKKISGLFQTLSLIFLGIAICYCVFSYGIHFDQTIWNNKMLEEYNKLTDPFERDVVDSEDSEGLEGSENSEGLGDSKDLSNSSDYEDIMRQLMNIKSLTDKVGSKPEKLKQIRCISKGILIVAAILGVIAEWIDDQNRRKRNSKQKNTGKQTNEKSDVPQNPPSTEDGE